MKKILLLISSVAILGLSACGSDKNSQITTNDPSKKEIRVTSGLWSQPEEQQFIRDEIISVFEEETGIKVDLEIGTNEDIVKKLEAQLTSDGVVKSDVLIVHSGQMPRYINQGWVEPMDDLASEINLKFMETFSKSTKKDGKRYFLPISADVYLILANKKAMPYLPSEAKIDSLTWDQYKDWAIAIAEGEGEGKTVMPAQSPSTMTYQIGGIGLSYGAEYPTINSEEMKKAWNLIAEMGIKKAIIPTTFSYGNPVDPMKRGEAWLTFFHQVPLGEIYGAAPAQYEIASAPRGEIGNGSIAGAWGLGLGAHSPNRLAATEFIKYITKPEVMYEISAGTGGFIPPVEEVTEKLGKDPQDEIIKKGIESLKTGKTSGVPSSDYTDWNSVKVVYDTLFEEIYRSGKVDEELLNKKQEELEALKK